MFAANIFSVESPRCTKAEMATRYPSFIMTVEDQREIAYWCPAELEDWRKAVTAHYRIANVDRRMANFKVKSAALDALKSAYYGALLQACEDSFLVGDFTFNTNERANNDDAGCGGFASIVTYARARLIVRPTTYLVEV